MPKKEQPQKTVTVQARISQTESEMLDQIKKRIGATSNSEGVRYAITYTALNLIKKGKGPINDSLRLEKK